MGEHDPRDPGNGDDGKAGLGRKILGLFGAGHEVPPPRAAGEDEEITAVGKVLPPELRASLASSLPKRASAPAQVPVAVAAVRPPAPASYESPDFAAILASGGLSAKELAQLETSAAATRAIAVLEAFLATREQELKTQREATEQRLAELRAEMERLQTALAERQAAQHVLAFDVHQHQNELRATASKA